MKRMAFTLILALLVGVASSAPAQQADAQQSDPAKLAQTTIDKALA
jgi:hypothetical protein